MKEKSTPALRAGKVKKAKVTSGGAGPVTRPYKGKAGMAPGRGPKPKPAKSSSGGPKRK